MTANARLALSFLIVATLAAPCVAWAGNPIELTNGQLDHITAGGAGTIGSADASAAGVLAFTQTQTQSLATLGPSPVAGNPFNPTAAYTAGSALAAGSNLGLQGGPPASSSTAVNTAGAAEGNYVINSTINQTVHGAGGVTFQLGWTFVYGEYDLGL